jgi:hypothetical protein
MLPLEFVKFSWGARVYPERVRISRAILTEAMTSGNLQPSFYGNIEVDG